MQESIQEFTKLDIITEGLISVQNRISDMFTAFIDINRQHYLVE